MIAILQDRRTLLPALALGLTTHAFIVANKSRPFFLYLPYTAPHAPLAVPTRFPGLSAGGLYGEVVEDTLNSEELMAHLLNGHTLDDFSGLAHIKFGPMFGEPSFSAQPLSPATSASARR